MYLYPSLSSREGAQGLVWLHACSGQESEVTVEHVRSDYRVRTHKARKNINIGQLVSTPTLSLPVHSSVCAVHASPFLRQLNWAHGLKQLPFCNCQGLAPVVVSPERYQLRVQPGDWSGRVIPVLRQRTRAWEVKIERR